MKLKLIRLNGRGCTIEATLLASMVQITIEKTI